MDGTCFKKCYCKCGGEQYTKLNEAFKMKQNKGGENRESWSRKPPTNSLELQRGHDQDKLKLQYMRKTHTRKGGLPNMLIAQRNCQNK